MKRLTRRQRQCVELIGEDLSNKEIARRLGLSERTVDAHLVNAYITLGVHDRDSAYAVLGLYLQEKSSLAGPDETPTAPPVPAAVEAHEEEVQNERPTLASKWLPQHPVAMLGLIVVGALILAILLAGFQVLLEVLFVGVERLSRSFPDGA